MDRYNAQQASAPALARRPTTSNRGLHLIRIGLISVALAMSACDQPPQTGQEHADAATRAACQKRADVAYNQQNRAEIYSPPPTVNTPYSANFMPGMTDRGLSNLFVHDRLVSDCIRNTGTGAERNPSSIPKR